jgi:predicted MPP superfamily phosphohydrolase
MLLIESLVAASVFLGHVAFCVATFNRLHAYGIPRRLRRQFELVLFAWFWLALCGYAWLLLTGRSLTGELGALPTHVSWVLLWPAVCCGALLLAVPLWLWPRLTWRKPECLVAERSEKVDVAALIGPLTVHGRKARFLSAVPGNEVYHLETTVKTIRLRTLPVPLEGLTITHLSDLHFTGDLEQRYYDYVVDAANRLASDLVVITGDIVESLECEAWLETTLGRLHAPLGCYFVLGNHDRRMPNVARVRERLVAAGFTDVGSRVLPVLWRETPVLLVGDERPWFPGPPEAALQQQTTSAFPILLAHTPDRFPWAQQWGCPLTLAGHNHGGQVRFPWCGPLIAPSKWGTRYASGLFVEQDCVLHVSRGVAGEHAYRWNCPPELAQLVLVGAGAAG